MVTETIRVGPKSHFKSELYMGKVTPIAAVHIDEADMGKLSKQMFHFNLYLGKIEVNGQVRDDYIRAFVINGMCRFKRYSLLDVVLYKVGRLLMRFKGN